MERKLIEEKLIAISKACMNYDENSEQHGLLTGSVGISFFLFLSNTYIKDDKQYQRAFDILENSLSELSNSPVDSYTFCSGLAGIGWVVEYLNQKQIIDVDTDELLSDFDEQLGEFQSILLKGGQFDFLHEGGGIMLYFLIRLRGKSKNDMQIRAYLKEGIENLMTSAVEDHETIKWSSMIDGNTRRGYNICLSHGLSSVLVILSKISLLEDFKRDKSLLNKIQKLKNYILKQEWDVNLSGCFFPSTSIESQGHFGHSRLAWCYGDLGISRALIAAGENLSDEQLLRKGFQVLTHATQRRNIKKESVWDASLCHGTSGIMLSFMISNSPGIQKFMEPVNYVDTVDFWLDRTLEFTKSDAGLGGYRHFDPGSNTWKSDSFEILEGAAGVGLVLLSYLDDTHNDWDELLLYR